MADQVYAPFKTTTPKLHASFSNLVTPAGYKNKNLKYDITVVLDDSSQCIAMVDQLLAFQNAELVRSGFEERDTLLCARDVMGKNDKTEKWDVPTGKQSITFKSADREKFSIVGPDRLEIPADRVGMGDVVRVNGQAAYGVMNGDPYLTFYLNAIQRISGSGPSGVDAFDDESGGGVEDVFETTQASSNAASDIV